MLLASKVRLMRFRPMMRKLGPWTTFGPCWQRFQDAWGGNGALAFWLPSGKARIVSRPASAAYDWRLPTGYDGKTLPLSELIFSGARDDLQPIIDPEADKSDSWIGLYHPRVS